MAGDARRGAAAGGNEDLARETARGMRGAADFKDADAPSRATVVMTRRLAAEALEEWPAGPPRPALEARGPSRERPESRRVTAAGRA